MTTNSDRAPASSAVAYGPARRSPFKYVPGFLYILEQIPVDFTHSLHA